FFSSFFSSGLSATFLGGVGSIVDAARTAVLTDLTLSLGVAAAPATAAAEAEGVAFFLRQATRRKTIGSRNGARIVSDKCREVDIVGGER
ncbi:hypothetical protein PFISCL1PPCAC_5052, partial [Pristionchus fissidentatus]